MYVMLCVPLEYTHSVSFVSRDPHRAPRQTSQHNQVLRSVELITTRLRLQKSEMAEPARFAVQEVRALCHGGNVMTGNGVVATESVKVCDIAWP